MRAFEKYALQGRKKPGNPQIAILHTWHDQKLAEKYWRAALEHALKQRCVNNPQVIPVEAIKKELEETP